MRHWIPKENVGPRASGLFVYDVAIDLRTLFSVSLNSFEPELSPETVTKLTEAGWNKSSDSERLICPRSRREQIIPALAHSLIHWRITSNQSRTYSPQSTLAVSTSNDASRIVASIRADLTEESEFKRAAPVLDQMDGVSLYTAMPAKAYVPDVVASADALEQAEAGLMARLLEYNYDA
jgi:hypothetical protein